MSHKFMTPPFVIECVDTLTDIRKEKGLSRRNIADKTGVRIDYIAQYERGYIYPNQENYNKLAKFFNWEEWQS